jgi:hypothetical protein
LKDRRASRGTDLSGGEQQMLAIARALIPRKLTRKLAVASDRKVFPPVVEGSDMSWIVIGGKPLLLSDKS